MDETEVAFDPVVHDAVAHAPAEPSRGSTRDGEPPADGSTRCCVPATAGAGQVLRPAMVRVRG